MAIAIGIGVYELAALAAAAVAAMIVASPAGQKAGKALANEIADALAKDKTIDVAPPVEPCSKPCQPCPACPPIPPRTDTVPPSAPHWPCTGTHTHVYANVSRQNPRTCQCFCNKEEVNVICH